MANEKMEKPDFSKIWGENGNVTYKFSDDNYLKGWGFVGNIPPARGMFDAYFQGTDKKLKWLDNALGDYVNRDYTIDDTKNPTDNKDTLPNLLSGMANMIKMTNGTDDWKKPSATSLKDLSDQIASNNLYHAEATGYGIVSGCAPTISGLTVTVGAGIVHLADGTRKEIVQTNITLDNADPTNPRIDLVYINADGEVATVAGTAAASPSVPTLPTDGISVCNVTIAAGATTGTINRVQTITPNLANYGIVNVKDFGAVGDGAHDDTAAIQAAIAESKGIVYFPNGTYIISSVISLNNVKIIGEDKNKVLLKSSTTIFSPQNNVTISSMSFEIQKGAVIIKSQEKATNIRISDCIAVKGRLYCSFSLVYSNSYTDDDLSTNIIVSNNLCLNGDTDSAIYFVYAKNCIAEGNIVINNEHGIAWWGGDSNPSRDGNITNPRYAKNIIIANNIIYDIAGGGIWGSMGNGVTITGNIVENCGDVGIDFEGTTDGTATGNIVKDCKNGCLATFYYCKNIIFKGNTVRQTGNNGTLVFMHSNSSQNSVPNTSISIIGNTFQCDVLCSTMHSANKYTRISSNTFHNCKLNMLGNNAGEVIITENKFIFDNEVTNGAAISAGLTHFKNGLTIKNNIIRANTLSSGNDVFGIYAKQDDYNNVTYAYIFENTILGFDKSICFDACGANVRDDAYVYNNYVSGTITQTGKNGTMHTGGNITIN